MPEEKLPIEGKLPNRWQIYYYKFVGNFNYWIRSMGRRTGKTIKRNSSDYSIEIVADIPGDDISENEELMKFIDKNSLNKEILESAKKGAPLIKLGDGTEPKVMITSGVHGNELSPQIAALKLINELSKLELKGTIYITPFIAPEASALNSKLSRGDNLNLVADVPGTPTNIIFNKALKLKINSLADFHTTSTHPARDATIYFLSVESSKIAVYVNKKMKSWLLAHIYNPGTLLSVCNTYYIHSILCEVESPDGIASNDSIEVSYNQMKAFLEYHNIL